MWSAAGQPAPVPYQPDMFNYGANNFGDSLPADLGFAGFRIHYPLHRPDYFDELAVYLGASYFRILGRNQIYGASARGLAVDTAATSGEDFPRFREFWIEEPGADATRLTIYALLDSRSATGAYRFVLTPGTDTQAEVTASVYPRRDIAKLGMAPTGVLGCHASSTDAAVPHQPHSLASGDAGADRSLLASHNRDTPASARPRGAASGSDAPGDIRQTRLAAPDLACRCC